jgi:hypothetical protein
MVPNVMAAKKNKIQKLSDPNSTRLQQIKQITNQRIVKATKFGGKSKSLQSKIDSLFG